MTKSKATTKTHPTYTHSEILVIMGALMLVMFLAALDQSIVATALPKIATDLHGLNKLSWVATSYLLTSAISTPIYGKLSDLYGRKKIFQTAIVIFLIGSMLAGLSQNMTQLVAFRAIQGLGAGGLMSLAITIIADIVPPRQRGRYTGYFFAVFGVSSVIGPLLGGFLTDALSTYRSALRPYMPLLYGCTYPFTSANTRLIFLGPGCSPSVSVRCFWLPSGAAQPTLGGLAKLLAC
jgi:MFS family permease